jgi:hypothetical protein
MSTWQILDRLLSPAPPPLLDRKENTARMRSAENIQGGEFGGGIICKKLLP